MCKAEVAIVKHLIKELLEHFPKVCVANGEEESYHTKCNKDTIDECFACDEFCIYGIDKDGASAGFVECILGNDGYDVISDYAVRIEPYITKTLAYAETWE